MLPSKIHSARRIFNFTFNYHRQFGSKGVKAMSLALGNSLLQLCSSLCNTGSFKSRASKYFNKTCKILGSVSISIKIC